MPKPNKHLIYTDNIASALRESFESYSADTRFFLLTDSEVHRLCLPYIEEVINEFQIPVFRAGQGESNKSLDQLSAVWDFLLENRADRHSSVLINLGGGLITDLGAFAATVYKRGISYINIPTSLLAMADASVGGKTGINYGGAKNQIGTFGQADSVIIFPPFTKTLDRREFTNGLAEMFKHAVLLNKEHWNRLHKFALSLADNNNNEIPLDLIKQSVDIKMKYVQSDRFEKGERAVLNFGHTFGHAIESAAGNAGEDIKHGESVAAGMIMESFVAHKLQAFPLKDLLKITRDLSDLFDKIDFVKKNSEQIKAKMSLDKKNEGTKIKCSLPKVWGCMVTGIEPGNEHITEALNFYNQL